MASKAPERRKASDYPHTLAELPESSEPRRRHRDWRDAAALDRKRLDELGELRERRDAWEAIVKAAHPDSDMLRVAAAKAGLEVIAPHIAKAERLREETRDQAEQLQDAYEAAWGRYAAALGELGRLQGEGRTTDPGLYTRLEELLGGIWMPTATTDRHRW